MAFVGDPPGGSKYPRLRPPKGLGVVGALSKVNTLPPWKPSVIPTQPPPINTTGGQPQQTGPIVTGYSYSPGAQAQLDQINAMKAKAINQAKLDAAAAREQAIIQSGLGSLAEGLGLSAGTTQAATDNPFSDEANLQRQYAQQLLQEEQGTNAQNLYYSSTHATRATNEATAKAQAEAALIARVRALLTNITNAETGGIGSAEATALAQSLGISPEPTYAPTIEPIEPYTGAVPGAWNEGNLAGTSPAGWNAGSLFNPKFPTKKKTPPLLTGLGARKSPLQP